MNAQVLIALALIVGIFSLLSVAIYRLGVIAQQQPEARQTYLNLMNPASIVSLLILMGVLFLLGMAILDLDKGRVLAGMGRTSFARGLITYLFAVVTIGTAVVLVLSALLGTDKARFDSGKEVLGLLLGVFGTIVGFYFASELAQSDAKRVLSISAMVSPQDVAPSGDTTVTVSLQGGEPPYRYAISIDDDLPAQYPELVRPDGWIVKSVSMPASATPGIHQIRIGVQDRSGERATSEALVAVVPPNAPR